MQSGSLGLSHTERRRYRQMKDPQWLQGEGVKADSQQSNNSKNIIIEANSIGLRLSLGQCKHTITRVDLHLVVFVSDSFVHGVTVFLERAGGKMFGSFAHIRFALVCIRF